MNKSVCVTRSGVKRTLYRLRWRGLRMDVRADHTEILQLVRLLSSVEGVRLC